MQESLDDILRIKPVNSIIARQLGAAGLIHLAQTSHGLMTRAEGLAICLDRKQQCAYLHDILVMLEHEQLRLRASLQREQDISHRFIGCTIFFLYSYYGFLSLRATSVSTRRRRFANAYMAYGAPILFLIIVAALDRLGKLFRARLYLDSQDIRELTEDLSTYSDFVHQRLASVLSFLPVDEQGRLCSSADAEQCLVIDSDAFVCFVRSRRITHAQHCLVVDRGCLYVREASGVKRPVTLSEFMSVLVRAREALICHADAVDRGSDGINRRP